MNKIEGKFLEIFPFEFRNILRKGQVSDNVNYLIPSTIDHFSKILLKKLSGSGSEGQPFNTYVDLNIVDLL
ncbi:hypothetical protein REPUB_Repub20aG0004300 [Reevesia pubescens]